MTPQQMIDLKNGDQVIFSGSSLGDSNYLPPVGTVFTRRDEWLDDDMCRCFDFIDQNGIKDYHFFYADEIDFIKE